MMNVGASLAFDRSSFNVFKSTPAPRLSILDTKHHSKTILDQFAEEARVVEGLLKVTVARRVEFARLGHEGLLV